MNGAFHVSRPKCRLACELPPLAVLAAGVAAVMMAFPRGAVGMGVEPEPERRALCAFVELSAEEEAKALESARAAWQLNAAAASSMRIEMMSETLPEERPGSVADVSLRTRTARCGGAEYSPSSVPPSVAAPPPAMIEPDPASEKPVPAFSKEELLKLK